MSRQIPIRKWTCSQHDYPAQCECCERWDCDECARSEWKTVGSRDATWMEDALFRMYVQKARRETNILINEMTREPPESAEVRMPIVLTKGDD